MLTRKWIKDCEWLTLRRILQAEAIREGFKYSRVSALSTATEFLQEQLSHIIGGGQNVSKYVNSVHVNMV